MLNCIAPSAFALAVAGCVTIDYATTKPGTLTGDLFVLWVGEDKFVYATGANPLTFKRASGKPIQPGVMYTDGGSIPKIAQPLEGFSPWGYAPAYMIHDWIFVGHHCIVDGKNDGRFDDVKDVSFDESAVILAEVIKTLIETNQVPSHDLAFSAISNAVGSFIAKSLWDKTGACETIKAKHLAKVKANPDVSTRRLKSLYSAPFELEVPGERPAVTAAKTVARFSFGPARPR